MSQNHETPDTTATYSTPRWVKAFGIIAVLILLFVIVQFIIGGNHNPNRHKPSADTTPASAIENHSPSVEHGR